MADWRDLLDHTPLNVAMLLQVEGIPYVFTDCELVNLNGTPLTTVTIGGETYTILHVLEAGQPITVDGGTLALGSGLAEGGGVDLRFVDTRDDKLLKLFKVAGANKAYLRDDLALGGAVATVNSTSGFAAPAGTLYMGRETHTYTGVAGATFTGRAGGKYGSMPTAYEYISEPSPVTRRISIPTVTDYPRVWQGRRVYLRAVMLTAGGRVYNDDPVDADYAPIVFSGAVDSLDLAEDYAGWSMFCKPAISLVRRSLPYGGARGQLYSAAGGYVEIGQAANGAIGARNQILFSGDTPWTFSAQTVGVDAGTVPIADFLDELQVALDAGFTAVIPAGEYTSCEVWIAADGRTFVVDIVHTVTADVLVMIGDISPGGYPGVTTLPFTAPQNGVALKFGAGCNALPFCLDNFPSGTIQRADDTAIPAILEDTGAWPASGYAVLKTNSTVEVIYYSAVWHALYPSHSVFELPNNGRGLLGTEARAYAWTVDDANQVDIPAGAVVDEDVEIRSLTVLEGDLGTSILRMLTSTGNANNGAYDTLDREAGLGIPQGMVDTTGFSSLNADAPDKSVVLNENLDVADWLDAELYRWGYAIAGRMIDSACKLGVFPAEGLSFGAVELSEDDISWARLPQYADMSEVANQISARLSWDFSEDDWAEPPIIYNDIISQDEVDPQPLDIASRCALVSLSSAIAAGLVRAGEILNVSTKPRYTVVMGVGLVGYRLALGDTVRVTWPEIPSPLGVRGLDDVPMRIVGIAYAWHPDDGQAPVELTLEHRPALQDKLWSPSAKLTVIAGATLTLHASEFGTLENDYEYFDVADKVRFVNTKLNAYEDRTIVSKSGANIVISAILPAPWLVGDIIYMYFDDYGDQVADQRKEFANMSSSAGFVVGTTEGDKWV